MSAETAVRDGVASTRAFMLRILAIVLVVLAGTALALWGILAPRGTGSDSQAPAAADGWIPFGPFQKPAVFADDPGITGPSDIRVPQVGLVRLNAADFLPGMQRYAPDMEIETERYTYAYDGHAPMIVAVVQVAEKLHYRRYVETKYSTYVLGLTAESAPRVLTTWPIYNRGAVHTVALTGLSEQGVIVLFMAGMHDGVNDGSRLDGIDVARGTGVWRLVHGYPGEGPGIPTFYTATAPDACATKVETYEPASGVVTDAVEYPAAGGICKRAEDPR